MAQDDDSFGLPDLNYKPLEPKKETPAAPPKIEKKVEKPVTTTRIQSTSTLRPPAPPKNEEPEADKSRVVIGILVPIIILVGAYFGYVYLYKKPKEEKARIEQIAQEEAAKKKKQEQEEAARLAKEREEADRLTREANAKPAIGTIETLSAKTGRWYVVSASSVDDDLIMDEAQRMSVKGVSTKIIPPYGKWKYFRLTISDHDSFALADASAKEFATTYNGKLWVMKY